MPYLSRHSSAGTALALTWLVVFLGSREALAFAAAPDQALSSQVESGGSVAPARGGQLSTVHGLFPLWEHTGVLQSSGGFQIGYNHAHWAYGPAQISTQPFLDLYGVLNAQAKLSVLNAARLKVALIAGVYRLPTNAQGRMLGNLNPTGFVNLYSPVFVAPLSLAKSIALGKKWAVHWASTVLAVQSAEPGLSYLAGGQSFLIEALASPSWRARIHAGIEGIGVQGQGHLGMSFAYLGDVVFLAAGAGQRLTFSGERSTFLMFDGGLAFQ